MQDPRDLLNQEFQKRKQKNPSFSLRAFAKWLEVSPAQLSQMMAGKRSITLKTSEKIFKRLGLSPLERRSLFVSAIHQLDVQENSKKCIQMSEDQFHVIADWYHFAILSLTKVPGASSDPRWVAKRLGIRVEDANQALSRLERMGILQLKPTFRQICDPIEVVSDVPSEAIRKYHKQNLNLAAEKIETVPVHLRQYQSISVALDPQKLPIFKKRIDEFLEEMSDKASRHSGSEIYNVNIQLFPVSIPQEGK